MTLRADPRRMGGGRHFLDIIANNFCENCQTVRPERSKPRLRRGKVFGKKLGCGTVRRGRMAGKGASAARKALKGRHIIAQGEALGEEGYRHDS